MPEPHDPWKQLVEASRESRSREEEAPPPELNVSSLRESVRALILAMTWLRWSLLAALLAGIIFLVIFLFLRQDEPPREPIIPPEPPTDPAAS